MQDIINKIRIKKKNQDFAVLAHNYVNAEIFKIADAIGDSLELAKISQNIPQKKIIFAGVKFMAQTAKLLNLTKKIFLPSLDSSCEMANMVDIKILKNLQKKNPKAATVGYINTTAETKVFCDICCTSANAVEICKQIPEKEIIFLPDKNLGSFVAEKIPNKKIILFPGFCQTHCCFSADNFFKKIEKNPKAEILIHPETPKKIRKFANAILGTGEMKKIIKKSKKNIFLIGTDPGMIGALQFEFPEKKFIPLFDFYCSGMKKNSLLKILKILENEKNEIKIPEKIFNSAKLPVEKMMRICL